MVQETNVQKPAPSKNLVVNIKLLNDSAVLPTYAKDGDAGMDLVVTSVEYDKSLNCYVYHTGISIEIPEGYVGYIFPRSSNRKTQCYLTNSVGVIDSGYRGEILVCFKDVNQSLEVSPTFAPYKVGDRCAQLVIMPYPKVEFNVVDTLSETERGEGGYGHTGE